MSNSTETLAPQALAATEVGASPARRAWQRFTVKLAKRGIVWQPWEGPDTLAARAASQYPLHAKKIHAIARSYIGLRYAAHPSGAGLVELNQHIRDLSL